MSSLVSFVPVSVWAVFAAVGVLVVIDLASLFIRSVVSMVDGKSTSWTAGAGR